MKNRIKKRKKNAKRIKFFRLSGSIDILNIRLAYQFIDSRGQILPMSNFSKIERKTYKKIRNLICRMRRLYLLPFLEM